MMKNDMWNVTGSGDTTETYSVVLLCGIHKLTSGRLKKMLYAAESAERKIPYAAEMSGAEERKILYAAEMCGAEAQQWRGDGAQHQLSCVRAVEDAQQVRDRLTGGL